MLVAVEKVRAGIVGDVEVGPGVVVVVAPGCAQSVVVRGIVDAGFLRDLFKRAVALVVKEQVGLAR